MKLKYKLSVAFMIIIIVSGSLFGLMFFGWGRSPESLQGLVLLGERRSVIDFFISSLLLMTFTAAILITWMYHGIMRNMETLVKAADNIRDGNLNFTIELTGNDEVSEVGHAFEEMRKRLKADAQEKIEVENDQRMLISNIAHDLKTPLTAIRGYSEGLMDGVAKTPERQESYLMMIHAKAHEMDMLINELTIYAQLQTNRIPYNFQVLDAAAYFSECAKELFMDLANEGIGFTYNSEVKEGVRIVADPEQTTRAINNLIANSVKYRRSSGPNIDLSIRDVGDFVQAEISDNGQGISKEDMPHIFDRLFRGDSSRNSSVRGSGLGLSIVKKIVEDQGGQIWCTSKEGEGTVMYFVLRKHADGDDDMEGEEDEQNSDYRRRRGNRRTGKGLS